jgi:hypothetical protein
MKHRPQKYLLLTFLFLSLISIPVFSQSWEFAKEKDGIRVYTRKEPNSTLKSFKGETIFNTSIDKVFFILGDATNFDWWDKDISLIKVLSFEPGKNIKYYLVYDVPWPLADRDLAVNSEIAINPTTGDRTITATPLLNVIPEKKDIVRIKKYWQRWTVQPMENGKVKVILEGFVDPAGSVPAWLYNMTITETPLKVIQSLKDMVLTGKTTKR